MNRQQEPQWKDPTPARHATAVDNKASQHPDKRFHQAAAFNASWSPATEFEELVAESRAHQLRKEIDPRGHLLAVLDLIDVQWPEDKTASVQCPDDKIATKRKPSRLVKSGAMKDLPPPNMLVSNPPSPPNISLGVQGILDARTAGRKPPLLKSSTMRTTNSLPPQRFAGSFSSLRLPSEPSQSAPVEESPPSVASAGSRKPLRRGGSAPRDAWACSGGPRLLRLSLVGLPTLPRDIRSASQSPARSLSEPGRMLRGWSDSARTPTTMSRGSQPSHLGIHLVAPLSVAPATALPSSGGGVRLCWRAERRITSEFFPERTHPPVGL